MSRLCIFNFNLHFQFLTNNVILFSRPVYLGGSSLLSLSIPKVFKSPSSSTNRLASSTFFHQRAAQTRENAFPSARALHPFDTRRLYRHLHTRAYVYTEL